MTAVDIIFNTIIDIWVIIKWTWWLFLLAFLVIYHFKWKNYPVDVQIIEKRGDNFIKTNDRAGKFIDPFSKMIGYKLHKAKDTIPVIDFDWVLVNVPVDNTIFEKFLNKIRPTIGTVFLFKYGSKQYKPIDVKFNGITQRKWVEIKDKKGNPKIISIYEQYDPRKVMSRLNFEVIDWDNINFMVQEQRASIERRKKSSEFWKGIAVPLALAAITLVLCIVMIKYGFDYGTMLKGSAPPTQAKPPDNPIPVIPGS